MPDNLDLELEFEPGQNPDLELAEHRVGLSTRSDTGVLLCS